MLLLALYKFTIFLGLREFYIFFALFLHTDRKYFLTPPTRETPQKMLFYSEQYSTVLMGVLFVAAALLLCFFIPTTQLSLIPSAREKGDDSHYVELAWNIFWKCFYFLAKKCTTTIPHHPQALTAHIEEKYKIPLKI